MGVHSARSLDCDYTDYMVEALRLEGLQRWEDPWQDLVVEPQVGRLKRGRCKVRRERGILHPGEHSRAGRSQAEAGRMERPLECAGLHSSSVHH